MIRVVGVGISVALLSSCATMDGSSSIPTGGADQVAEAGTDPQMGTLMVFADANCSLQINGIDHGVMTPGVARNLILPVGAQTLECHSTELDGIHQRQLEVLQTGTRSMVLLELAEQIRAVRQEEQAAATQSEVTERREALDRRFERRPDGIHDRELGVLWTAADNGSDIDWTSARNHCSRLGAAWSLPSLYHLQRLHDRDGTYQQVVDGWVIKPATLMIGWSGSRYWSSYANEVGLAFYIDLGSGSRFASARSSQGARVLCVRTP